VASTALALRPVAYTLGELYLLLGQREEADRQFDHAERVAQRWGAPHWAREARAAAALNSSI